MKEFVGGSACDNQPSLVFSLNVGLARRMLPDVLRCEDDQDHYRSGDQERLYPQFFGRPAGFAVVLNSHGRPPPRKPSLRVASKQGRSKTKKGIDLHQIGRVFCVIAKMVFPNACN